MILFGYGNTTKALAKLEQDVTVYDDSFLLKSITNNITFIPSKDYIPDINSRQIISPGIPPNHYLAKNGTNIISEYDYFAQSMPYSIWISGTNGKTTTTKMITHLLDNNNAIYGGNIGVPLANMDNTKSIWVLETSSFTLHYTKYAKPNLYILLPIKQDHISWHGNFDEYENSKLKPIYSLKEGEIAIVPKKYQNIKTKGCLITYENSNDLCRYFDLDIDKISHKEPFLLDALLALSVQKMLFDKAEYDKINSFINDNHKLQEIRDSKNRLWVNDSKATNIDATLWAIKRYSHNKIFLILGGDDKGIDNSSLFEEFSKIDIRLFLIGSNEKRLVKLSQQYNILFEPCKTMQNAIEKIDKLLTNQTALLSPSAASFDQFKSYEDRGRQFIEYIDNNF
jgi:UDP-N-acetylmuramoylalanine--D-glutamate ligase